MSLSILSKRLRAAGVRGEGGFSLLSTLLAVMIVAVLLTIAVPRFSSAIATANTVKVQADLTALDTAIVLYQTEKGKAPEKIDDLSAYVTDVKNLKPPSGKARAGGEELSLEGASYAIEKKDGVYRATCTGRTAEEFVRKD
nr:type II secretion system protein [uncultured Selenomonas sp.]